jgi:hypothetical protein
VAQKVQTLFIDDLDGSEAEGALCELKGDTPGVVLDLRGLLRQQAVVRLNLRRRSPHHAGN